MKIYFAGAIRGGREDQQLYLEIINYLKQYGEVLTEHVGDDSINILSIVYSIDKKLLNKINIQIKIHPTMNKKILCNKFDFKTKKVNFSKTDAFGGHIRF